MEYRSFEEFMESAVLPHQVKNPTFIRLDGASTGGDRKVFGQFRHKGKLWKVHADTPFKPLELAYAAIKQGKIQDPFIERPTEGGTCLALVDDIQRQPKVQAQTSLYLQRRVVLAGRTPNTSAKLQTQQFDMAVRKHKLPLGAV